MGQQIGDYIHYNSINYLKYGLSQNDKGQKPNIEAVFNEQIKNLHNLAKFKKDENYIKKIQTQLNYYFDATKKTETLTSELSNEDINNMKKAIVNFLGEKMKNINIDEKTLKGYKTNNDLINKKNRVNEDIYEQLSLLASKDKLAPKGQRVTVKKLSERIKAILELRQNIKNENITQTLDNLITQWQIFKEENKGLFANRSVTLKPQGQKFINDLNDFISQFLKISTGLAGEYAEAVVVATNFLVNTTTDKTIENIKKALEKGIKGTERSSKGLDASLFSKEFVDLEKVVANSIYHKVEGKDGFDNYYSINITQDKVDAIITFNELDIATSIKNYDLSNIQFKDIHFLKGRSVLALTQEFTTFTNHYLNVMGTKPKISTYYLNRVQKIMKLTILLKAIQGSVFSSKGKTQAVELLIINDNSKGEFKVYTINQILSRVENDINLLKTGDLDNIPKDENFNGFIGQIGILNRKNAKERISHLLAELHQMELNVSVDKKVFLT